MKLSAVITLFVMTFAVPATVVLLTQASMPGIQRSLCIAWSGAWFLAFLVLIEWRWLAALVRRGRRNADDIASA